MRQNSTLYLVIVLVITLLLSSLVIAEPPTDGPPDASDAPAAPVQSPQDAFKENPVEYVKNNPDYLLNNPEQAKTYYSNLDNVGKNPDVDAKFFAQGSNAVDNLQAATKFLQVADVKHIREAKEGAKQVFEKIYPGVQFDLTSIDDDFIWDKETGILKNGEKQFEGLNKLENQDSSLPDDKTVSGIEAVKGGLIITYKDGNKVIIDGLGEIKVGVGIDGLEVEKGGRNYILKQGKGASIHVQGDKLTFTNFESGKGASQANPYSFTGNLVVTADTISSDSGSIKFNKYTIDGAFEIKVKTNEISIWDSNGPTTFLHTDPIHRIAGHEGNMLMVKSGGQTKGEKLTIHLTNNLPVNLESVKGEHVYLGVDGVNPIAALKGRASIVPVQQTEGGLASLVDRSVLTGKNKDAFVEVAYFQNKESMSGGGQVRINRVDQDIDFSNNKVRFGKNFNKDTEHLDVTCEGCSGKIGTIQKDVIADNKFIRIPTTLVAGDKGVKGVIDPRFAGKLQGEVIGNNLIILSGKEGIGIVEGAVVEQEGAARTQQVGVAAQAGRVTLSPEQQAKVAEFERLKNAHDVAGMKALASQMDPNLRRYISATSGINLDALDQPVYAAKVAEYFATINKPKYGVNAWAASVQKRLAKKNIHIEFDNTGNCITEGCAAILQKEYNKRNANSHHIIKLYAAQASRDLALAEGAVALAAQPGSSVNCPASVGAAIGAATCTAAATSGAPQPGAGEVKRLKDLIKGLRATKSNWNVRYERTVKIRAEKELNEIRRQQAEYEAAVQDVQNQEQAAALKDPEAGMDETQRNNYRARKAAAAALAQQVEKDRISIKQFEASKILITGNRDRYQRQLDQANREIFTDNDQPERDLITARNALQDTNYNLRKVRARASANEARIRKLAEQETNPRARGHIYSAAGKEKEAAAEYGQASAQLAALGEVDQGLQKNLFASSHRSIDPNNPQSAQQYKQLQPVVATINDPLVKQVAAATVRHHTQVKPVMNAYIDSVNEAARANINSQSWSFGSGAIDWVADHTIIPAAEAVGHVFVETLSAGENYKDHATADINGKSYDFSDKDPNQVYRDANQQAINTARMYQRMKEGADLDDLEVPDGYKAQANIWRKQRHGQQVSDADRDAALLEKMENKVKVVGMEKAAPTIKQTQGQLKTAEAVAKNGALVERVIDVEDTAGTLDIVQAAVEITVSLGAAGLAKAAAKTAATTAVKTLARAANIANKIVDPLFEVAPKLIGAGLKRVGSAVKLLPPAGSADDLLRGAAGSLPPPSSVPDAVPLVRDVVSDDKIIRTVVSPDRKTVKMLEVDPTTGVARKVSPDESPLLRSIADDAKVKAQPYQPPALREGRASSLDTHLDPGSTPQRPRVQKSGTKEAPIETRVWPESGQVQKIEMAADGTPKKITTVQPDGSVTIREAGPDGVLLRGRTANVAEKAQASADAAIVKAKAIDLPLAAVENPVAALDSVLSPAGRTSAENAATAAQILDDPGLRRALDDATLTVLDDAAAEGVSLGSLAGKATDTGPLKEALEKAAADLPVPNPGKTQVNKVGKNGVEIIKTDASGNVVKKIKYDGKKIDITEFGPDGKITKEVSDTLKNLADVSEGTAKYADDIAGDVAAVSSAKQLLDTTDNTFRHWLGNVIENTLLIKKASTRLTKIDTAITTAKAELKTALGSGEEAAIRLANSKVRNLEIGYQAAVSSRGRLLHAIIRPRSFLDPEKRALIQPKALAYKEALTAFEEGLKNNADNIGAFIAKNPQLAQNVENARSAYLSSLAGYSRTAKVNFNGDAKVRDTQGFDASGAPSDIYRGKMDDVLSPGDVDVRVSNAPATDVNPDDIRAALHEEVLKSDELKGVIPTARYRGVTEIGGRPGVAIDTMSGTKFTGNPASMTDAQITELGKEGIDKLTKHLDEAAKKGWAPDRVSFVKLDKPQKINGVQYQAGDLVFTDVHGWKVVAKTDTTTSLIPKVLRNRLDEVGKTPGTKVVDDVVPDITPDIIPTPTVKLPEATWDANVGRWRTPDGRFAKNEVKDLYEWRPSTGRFHHKTGSKRMVSFDEVTKAQNAKRQAVVSDPSFSQVDLIGGGKRETNILPEGKVEIVETDATGTMRKRITSDGEDIKIERFGDDGKKIAGGSGGPISAQGKSSANEIKLVEDALNPKAVPEAPTPKALDDSTPITSESTGLGSLDEDTLKIAPEQPVILKQGDTKLADGSNVYHDDTTFGFDSLEDFGSVTVRDGQPVTFSTKQDPTSVVLKGDDAVKILEDVKFRIDASDLTSEQKTFLKNKIDTRIKLETPDPTINPGAINLDAISPIVKGSEAPVSVQQANKAALGDAVSNPEVARLADELPVPITCSGSSAVTACVNPKVTAKGPDDMIKAAQLNDELALAGKPQIEVINDFPPPKDPIVEGKIIDTPEEIIPNKAEEFRQWKQATHQRITDSPNSIHAASDVWDNSPFINPHGTHKQYLDTYAKITDNNPVLNRLHQKFADKDIPISLTDDLTPAEFADKNAFATLQLNGVPRYKLFESEKELLDFASRKYQFSSFDEARALLAREQVSRIAGHETMHHAYRRFLEPGQVEKWEAFVKSKFADPNHPYSATRKRLLELKYDEADIIEEMFTYRMHIHATGEPELRMFDFVGDADEIAMFKELDMLPQNYHPNAPKVKVTPDELSKSLDDLTASGGSINCPIAVGAAGGLGNCKIKVDTPEQLQKARDYQARNRADGKELDIEYQGKFVDPKTTTTDVPDTDFFEELGEFKTVHPDTLDVEGDLVSVLDGRRPVALSPPSLVRNQVAGNPALQAALDSGELVRREVKYVQDGYPVTMVGIHRRGSTIGAQSVDKLEDIYQSGRSITAQGDREIGTILRYPDESIDEYIAMAYPTSGVDEVTGVVPLRGLDPPTVVDDVVVAPKGADEIITPTKIKDYLENDGSAWLATKEGQEWAKLYDDRSFVGRLLGGKVDPKDLDLAKIGDDLPTPLRTVDDVPTGSLDEIVQPSPSKVLDDAADDLAESGGRINCPFVGAASGLAACTASVNTPEQLEKAQKLQAKYNAEDRVLDIEYQGRVVDQSTIDDLLPPPKRNLVEEFAGHKAIVEEMKDFKGLNRKVIDGTITPAELARLETLKAKYLTNNKLIRKYDTITSGAHSTADKIKAAGKQLEKVEDQVLFRVGLQQTDPTEHLAIISDYFGTEKYGHIKSKAFARSTEDAVQYSEDVAKTMQENAGNVVKKYLDGFEASSGQRVTITEAQAKLLQSLVDNEVDLIRRAVASGEIAKRAADAGVTEAQILRQFNNDLADSLQRMVINDGVLIHADGGSFRIGAGVSRIRESNGLDHVVGNQLRARQIMEASEEFQQLTALQKLEVLEAMRYHDYGKSSMWNNAGAMQEIGLTGDISGSHVVASVKYINADRTKLSLKYGEDGAARIVRVANRHDHPHYLRIGEVNPNLSPEGQRLARIQNVQYNAATIADNMAGVRVKAANGDLIADKLVAGINDIPGNENILSKAFSLDDKIGLEALARAGISKNDAINALRLKAIDNIEAALARGDITEEMALAYKQAFNDDFGAFAARFMRRTHTPGETTFKLENKIIVIDHRASGAAQAADDAHPGLLYDSQRGTTDPYWDRVFVDSVEPGGQKKVFDLTHEDKIVRDVTAGEPGVILRDDRPYLKFKELTDKKNTGVINKAELEELKKLNPTYEKYHELKLLEDPAPSQLDEIAQLEGKFPPVTNKDFPKGWMRDKAISKEYKLQKAQKFTDEPASIKSSITNTRAKDWVYPEGHPKAGKKQVGVEHRFLDETTDATNAQKAFADQAKDNLGTISSIKRADEEMAIIATEIRTGQLDLTTPEGLREVNDRLQGFGLTETPVIGPKEFSKLSSEQQIKKLETIRDNFIQRKWQNFYDVTPTAKWDASAARWRGPNGQFIKGEVSDLYKWNAKAKRFQHTSGPKNGKFASFDEVTELQNAKARKANLDIQPVREPTSRPDLSDDSHIDDVVDVVPEGQLDDIADSGTSTLDDIVDSTTPTSHRTKLQQHLGFPEADEFLKNPRIKQLSETPMVPDPNAGLARAEGQKIIPVTEADDYVNTGIESISIHYPTSTKSEVSAISDGIKRKLIAQGELTPDRFLEEVLEHISKNHKTLPLEELIQQSTHLRHEALLRATVEAHPGLSYKFDFHTPTSLLEFTRTDFRILLGASDNVPGDEILLKIIDDLEQTGSPQAQHAIARLHGQTDFTSLSPTEVDLIKDTLRDEINRVMGDGGELRRILGVAEDSEHAAKVNRLVQVWESGPELRGMIGISGTPESYAKLQKLAEAWPNTPELRRILGVVENSDNGINLNRIVAAWPEGPTGDFKSFVDDFLIPSTYEAGPGWAFYPDAVSISLDGRSTIIRVRDITVGEKGSLQGFNRFWTPQSGNTIKSERYRLNAIRSDWDDHTHRIAIQLDGSVGSRTTLNEYHGKIGFQRDPQGHELHGGGRQKFSADFNDIIDEALTAKGYPAHSGPGPLPSLNPRQVLERDPFIKKALEEGKSVVIKHEGATIIIHSIPPTPPKAIWVGSAWDNGKTVVDDLIQDTYRWDKARYEFVHTAGPKKGQIASLEEVTELQNARIRLTQIDTTPPPKIELLENAGKRETRILPSGKVEIIETNAAGTIRKTIDSDGTTIDIHRFDESGTLSEPISGTKSTLDTSHAEEIDLVNNALGKKSVDSPTALDSTTTLDEVPTVSPAKVNSWLENEGQAWLRTKEGQDWAAAYDERSGLSKFFGKAELEDLNLETLGADLPTPLVSRTPAEDLVEADLSRWLREEGQDWLKTKEGQDWAKQYDTRSFTSRLFSKVDAKDLNLPAIGDNLPVPLRSPTPSTIPPPSSTPTLTQTSSDDLLASFAEHQRVVAEIEEFGTLNKRLMAGDLTDADTARLVTLRGSLLTDQRLAAKYDQLVSISNPTPADIKNLKKFEKEVLLRIGLDRTDPSEHFTIIRQYFGTEHLGKLDEAKFVSEAQDVAQYSEDVAQTIQDNARSVIDHYRKGFDAQSGQKVIITPGQQKLLDTLVDNEVDLISEALATGEIARRAAAAGVSEAVILKQFSDDLADSIQRMVIYDGVVMKVEGGSFRIGAGVSRLRESNGLDHVVGNQLRARQIMDASEGFQRLTAMQKLEVLEAMRYHDYGKGSMWNNVGVMTSDVGRQLSDSHVVASVKFIDADRAKISLKYGDEGVVRIKRITNRHDHPYYLRVEGNPEQRIKNLQYNAATLADNMAGVRVRAPNGDIIGDKLVAAIHEIPGNEEVLSKAFRLSEGVGVDAIEASGSSTKEIIDALRLKAIENIDRAYSQGLISPELARLHKQAINDDFGETAANFMRRTHTPGETTSRLENGIVVIEHRTSKAAAEADELHSGLLYDSQRGTTDLYWDRVYIEPVTPGGKARAFDLTHSDGVVREITEDGSLIKLFDDQGKPIKSNKEFTKGWLRDKVTTGEYKLNKAQKFTDNPTTVSSKNAAADDWVGPNGEKQIGVEHRFLDEVTDSTPAQSKFAVAAKKNSEIRNNIEAANENINDIIESIRAEGLDLTKPEALREVNSRLQSLGLKENPRFDAEYFADLTTSEQIEMLALLKNDYIQLQWQRYYHIDGLRQAKELGIISGPSGQQIRLEDAFTSLGYSKPPTIELGTSVAVVIGISEIVHKAHLGKKVGKLFQKIKKSGKTRWVTVQTSTRTIPEDAEEKEDSEGISGTRLAEKDIIDEIESQYATIEYE
jgi:hypothetical protein